MSQGMGIDTAHPSNPKDNALENEVEELNNPIGRPKRNTRKPSWMDNYEM